MYLLAKWTVYKIPESKLKYSAKSEYLFQCFRCDAAVIGGASVMFKWNLVRALLVQLKRVAMFNKSVPIQIQKDFMVKSISEGYVTVMIKSKDFHKYGMPAELNL